MRLALSALLAAGAGVAGGALALGAAPPQTPVSLTGYDWARFGPDEREAYLAGFIAGAAAHQATGGRTLSGVRAAAAAVRLKRTGALDFPFGSNVYRSHLDDYYHFRNRRSETLIQTIVELNSQLRSPRD
jgi:hypothetical protein